MANFKVTFEDHRGVKRVMTVEGLSTTDAKENALFFSGTYGKPVKAVAVKGK